MKKNYVTPAAESINIIAEQLLATSGGDGNLDVKPDGPGVGEDGVWSKKKNSIWGSEE